MSDIPQKIRFIQPNDKENIDYKLDDVKPGKESANLEYVKVQIPYLFSNRPTKSYKDVKCIFCLVGNIIEERLDGDGNMWKGTKHFSPGTKLYCYPPIWGDGYRNIKVIGKHRKSPRLVTIIIQSKYITNWRLKTVYNPVIIQKMIQNQGWSDEASHKERIEAMAGWLNSESAFLENKRTLVVLIQKLIAYESIVEREKDSLRKVLEIINQYNYENRLEFKGLLSRTIVDSLELDQSLAEKLIAFDVSIK